MYNEVLDRWDELLPHILYYNYTAPNNQMSVISQQIKEFYKIDNTTEGRKNYAKLIGDRLARGSDRVFKLASIYNSPMCVYRFSYSGTNSFTDLDTTEKLGRINYNYVRVLEQLNLLITQKGDNSSMNSSSCDRQYSCGRASRAQIYEYTNIAKTLMLLSAVALSQGDISKDCYGHGCPVRYTPAPPGMTPSCARNGWTYCEEIENYPTHLILQLINNWAYNIDSLITNEEPESYHPRPVYGPPHYYTPPPVHQYQQQTNNVNMSQYTSHIQQIPRPYNTYRNNHDLYHGYFRPAYEVPPQDPHWWKTFGTFVRKKRQFDSQVSLCPVNAQFITPKAALNANGNWMYIVNEVSDQNQKYTQLIRTETCRSRVCNGICSLPNGYSSKCEQQFVQKRLVALDPRGEALYTDKFWLPHCCICQITQNIR